MSAPAAPRRRSAPRTERQAGLFDALVALFLAEGFTRLTLDDVAARLRCSKRTLYEIAGSKEQLVRAVVVEFFRRSTVRVEARVTADLDPAGQLVAYLHSVAGELAPASARFFDDVAAFPPAAEVYETNTRAAARRVQAIVAAGVQSGGFRDVDVAFAADVVSATMVRIQTREVAAATGLADGTAYQQLADLLLNGLLRSAPPPHG